MLSIMHYFSARNRLRESKKTILMMGGEDECQPMLLGQRDMVELEMEYYKEGAVKSAMAFVAIIFVVTIISYVFTITY